MFAQDGSTRFQAGALDSICAHYMETLHRELSEARATDHETRLQHERLSIRFSRRLRVGAGKTSTIGRSKRAELLD